MMLKFATREKMPIKAKLKAWWDGYDPHEVEARYLRSLNNGEAPDETTEQQQSAENQPVADDVTIDEWAEERIDVAQYIWGEGFCGPGGIEQIISMTKLLALSGKMSMIDLGAGLGGPARALAENFGVWVTGMERSANLVERGNDISMMHGMAKKVELHDYNPEKAEEFDRTYDRVFAKEALFTIQNKKDLIKKLFDASKPEALFLMTDYVLGDDEAIMNDDFREWRDREPIRPHCVTADEMTKMVTEAGFGVRVDEDISQQYIDLIANAWKGAEKVVGKLMAEENSAAMIDALLSEAEFWTRRSNLLKNGQLKVWRILGYKKSEVGSMSNW
jgi:2-polyprenyl-3-methyl-5-hydroxy-6-metoxy-1,4-benzoquinol methylase